MAGSAGTLAYVERDDAGNITAQYDDKLVKLHVEDGSKRVDYLQSVVAIFLPAGYPRSVSNDYLEYQIYDSLQAFSSSIAGLLASRAVLQGVGVGDSTATATNAVLLNILQDSIGRLATILFAHRLGTTLEPECKRYRFAADIFNDSAMVLDCLSPALPKAPRVGLLCLSGCLRALCGVTGGASKASLSVHFAKGNNVGELNAKDSSQETVISLFGMLAGSLVISRVTSAWSTWTMMIFLVGVHLWTNYRAVKAVAMRTLNRQRANIVISHFCDSGKAGSVMTPQAVSREERIFEWDGALRWRDQHSIGTASFERFQLLLSAFQQSFEHGPVQTAGRNPVLSTWPELVRIFEQDGYMLWSLPSQRRVIICLKQGCPALSALKGWMHALLLAHSLGTHNGNNSNNNRSASGKPPSTRDTMDSISRTKLDLDSQYDAFVRALVEHGWDLDSLTVDAGSGAYRVEALGLLVDTKKKS